MNGDVERVFRNKQSNIHSIILLADLMLAVNEMKKKNTTRIALNFCWKTVTHAPSFQCLNLNFIQLLAIANGKITEKFLRLSNQQSS